MTFIAPKEDLATIATIATDALTAVIAIDSQSDERSNTIPSTEGQKTLATFLQNELRALSFEGKVDDAGNLVVEIPGKEGIAPVCFMVHIDTARGTEAVSTLSTLSAWDGERIKFSKNPGLVVSATHYPETALFQGDDILFGPGNAPIGLDDKIGVALLLTLAKLLANNPHLPHPTLLLAFRPDEEIGRHAAVKGLAKDLKARGVHYGFTVDGIHPFEINIENFNAARASVRIDGRPLTVEKAAVARNVTIQITGVKSHGATAKSEGYLNASVILARGLGPISRRQDVIPLSFDTDPKCEVDAVARFQLRGAASADLDRAEQALVDALANPVAPHAWRGARVVVESREDVSPDAPLHDAAMRTFAHLATFLRSEGPLPVLSEDSSGHEGYSNPCALHVDETGQTIEYRLRDFDPNQLAQRRAHIERVAALGPGPMTVTYQDQYVNMGPTLRPFPHLVDLPERAARTIGETALVRPIRGGTGVDPFLDEGIPVANLGTGYFAPESEKELTSRQSIARHAIWLLALVEEMAKGTSA